MNIELVKKQQEAEAIYSFWWRTKRPFKYNSGEYIEMSIDFPNADERGNRHWYTLASSPTEELLMNATKFPPKHSTFKQALEKLQPGDEVQISPPMGDFILPRDNTQPLLFVAGGIGVTPFRSMAKFITDQKLNYPIQLLYAANKPSEFAFTELLDNAPGFEVTRMVSEQAEGWKGPVGKLSGPKIAELAGGLQGKLVYISGPAPMVKDFQKQLIEAGHPKRQVKIDDFPGYTEI